MLNRIKKAEKAGIIHGKCEHPNLDVLSRPMPNGAVIILGESLAAILSTEPGMYEQTNGGLRMMGEKETT